MRDETACQVVTTPCCGLAVIFRGFISHLIGRETINIQEILSGVHGFTGKTVKYARARCKTCLFICNVDKISGSKRSIKITDHFTCTAANVIYCITCTLRKKLYIGETERRLGDSENTFVSYRERRQKLIPTGREIL